MLSDLPKKLQARLSDQRVEAEEKDAERRAKEIGLPYLNLVSSKIPTELEAMRIVKERDAKEALLVPLRLLRRKLSIAVYNPKQKKAAEIIQKLKADYDLEIVVSSMRSLQHVWSYYQYIQETKEITGKVEINEDVLLAIKDKIKNLSDLSREIESFENPYISQVLEIVLAGAIALGASDIHMEPGKETKTLRLRIDGLLHIVYERFPENMFRAVTTRIKLLSSLKLNIHESPQDGRFTIALTGRDIEIRTSVIPSEYGETVVMRLLDPTALRTELEELGIREDDLKIITAELSKPNGLILNTGPTGSGKTTTLYAFLRKVQNPEVKIITIEDPIEYHIAGISQTQVNEDSHYTFESGLRSILRQDPDVILVGEIRDHETAEIALNASLTGHLVFSTLHTNDAIGAVPRLLDLGVKMQTLGPAISLVIAQRLVRRLCEYCREPMEMAAELKNKLDAFIKRLPARVDKAKYVEIKLYEANAHGCEKCAGLGYKGRISIFELFLVNEGVEALIYKNPTEIEIREYVKNEMVTMQEDGILKCLLGVTDFGEVERLTGPLEW